MTPTDSSLANQLEKLSQFDLRFEQVEPPLSLLDIFRNHDPHFQNRVQAAVCVLFEGQNLLDSRVLLTLRSSQVATHAGQVAFPGGTLDPSDEADYVRAALRECFEEVGIHPHSIRAHGVLPEFPTLGGHFTVRPVLASLGQPLETPLQLQVEEVVAAEWVSVRALLESREFEERSLFGHPVKAPVFWWGAHRMWGLSAWIFHSILTRYATLKP